MKKNKKRSRKMTVVASHTMYAGAVIISLAVMVVANHLAGSSCDSLVKSIGEKEREIDRLGDECTRAAARWDRLKDSTSLDAALRAHGLCMQRYAHESQRVRMRKDGSPEPRRIASKNGRGNSVRTVRYAPGN